MFIDTSAIAAILRREPGQKDLARRVADTDTYCGQCLNLKIKGLLARKTLA